MDAEITQISPVSHASRGSAQLPGRSTPSFCRRRNSEPGPRSGGSSHRYAPGSTTRSCTHAEVPIFGAGQRFIKAADRVEYRSKKESRGFDSVAALIKRTFVRTYIGPKTFPDSALRDNDARCASLNCDYNLGDHFRRQHHVGVNEPNDGRISGHSTCITLCRSFGSNLNEHVCELTCDLGGRIG